ncbi:hypothetical protein D3OALGA1CA_1850 [Olavius algarvensis associated proteobacterium Delta 3]|nr:hypothetical protein D3OALGA1CA_1850 [Olavius algarvensis associated proteobacterium Delta 3]CAB5135652.1 hypothetical protein D3OALGB2SA_3913 [Olavius algarvensis associated proteobacterium Delta 3]
MVIRPSQKADLHTMSRIYVQTWRDTYLSVLPYDYLFEMSAPTHEQAFVNQLDSNQFTSLVAEDAGRVIGFTTGGLERNGNNIYGGEIYTLYVLKNFQRQGIGGKLVSALAEQLNRIGIYSMLVRVLKRNPYRRFYIKMNGTYLKTEYQHLSGENLEVDVYGWLDTTLVNNKTTIP